MARQQAYGLCGASIEEIADLTGDDPITLYRRYRHRVRPVASVATRLEGALRLGCPARMAPKMAPLTLKVGEAVSGGRPGWLGLACSQDGGGRGPAA